DPRRNRRMGRAKGETHRNPARAAVTDAAVTGFAALYPSYALRAWRLFLPGAEWRPARGFREPAWPARRTASAGTRFLRIGDALLRVLAPLQRQGVVQGAPRCAVLAGFFVGFGQAAMELLLVRP